MYSDRYSDYKFRFLYIENARPKRWRLVECDNDYASELAKSTAVCYWTIQRYTEEARGARPEDVHQLDHVSPLMFDLDGHSNHVKNYHLIDGVYQIGKFLMQKLKIKEDDLYVWFSGRGFHVAVPAELIQSQPRSDIEDDYLRFAHWMSQSIDLHVPYQKYHFEDGKRWFEPDAINILDFSLYAQRKMIRMPGTINPNSRLVPNARKCRLPFYVIRTLAKKRTSKELNQSLRDLLKQPMWSLEGWI